MQPTFVIEDIRKLRLQEGIEDAELRAEIRGLRVGDLVRLTFQAGTKPCASETLLVRISRITSPKYRGKLVTGPRSAVLSELAAGSSVSFTAAHIHSCLLNAARPRTARSAAGTARKQAAASSRTSRPQTGKRAAGKTAELERD